jgi:hypothetical protein
MAREVIVGRLGQIRDQLGRVGHPLGRKPVARPAEHGCQGGDHEVATVARATSVAVGHVAAFRPLRMTSGCLDQ